LFLTPGNLYYCGYNKIIIIIVIIMTFVLPTKFLNFLPPMFVAGTAIVRVHMVHLMNVA